MKKKKIIIICIAGVALAAVAAANMLKEGTVTAGTIKAVPGEIRQYVEDTATVECRNKQTVYIEGTGKISEIKAEAGSPVKEGDLLLVMDDEELRMQLKNAEVGVEAAKAQIESTDSGNYADEIEIASVQVAQAEIANDSAVRTLEKTRALYEAGAISNEEFSKAEDGSKAAEAALNLARLQLEKAKKGVPGYIKKGYIAQYEQALNLVESLKRNLEKQKVKSPMDGVILEKLAEVNSIAAPGAPAFIIGDAKALELVANILSDECYKVEIGDEVEIRGKSLGDALLKGKVSKIAPEARTITSALGVNQKRVQVNIELMNENMLLKPGYNVDIKIVTDVKKGIVAVPDSALFDYEGNTCLFVVKDGRAEVRRVKKGIEGDGMIEITEGLAEGETILAEPDNRIKEGIRIEPL